MALSQTSTFTYPESGFDNVELIPTFNILTPIKIDSSSITEFYYCQDSAIYEFGDPQSILVLPKFIVDSIPDTLWKYLSVRGSYTLIDDNNLQFKPHSELIPGLQYTAILKNLKGITIEDDTVALTEVSVSFTTVPPAHKVISQSFFNNGGINCSDTLTVKYNRDLTSDTTAAGNLLELFKIDSIKVVNDSLTKFTTQISLNTWLEYGDNTTLRGLANSQLEPGESYIIKINSNYLTGDQFDYSESVVNIKKYMTLLLDVETDDSTLTVPYLSVFPDTGFTSIMYDDSLRIIAMKEVDSLIFLRWECPNDENIDSLQKNQFYIHQDCSELKNLYVKAIYGKKKAVVLTVEDNPNLEVNVYDSDNLYLGGSGTYSISIDDYVYVKLEGSSASYTLDYWQSSEQYLDRSDTQEEKYARKGDKVQALSTSFNTSRMIVSNFGRDINLGGLDKYTDPVHPHKFNFLTFVNLEDMGLNIIDDREDQNLAFNSGYLDIYVGGGYLDDPVFETGPTPQAATIKFEINSATPRCSTGAGFVIEKIQYDGYDIIVPPNSSSYSINATSQPYPYHTIMVTIKPNQNFHSLTVEAGWEEGHEGTGVIAKDFTVFADLMIGEVSVIQKFIESNNESMVIPEGFCDCEIKLTTTSKRKGIHFKNWKDDDPTEYDYPTPSTTDPWTMVLQADKKNKVLIKEGFLIDLLQLYIDDNRSSNSHITIPTSFIYNELMSLNGTITNLEVWNFDLTPGADNGYNTRILLKFNQKINPIDFLGKIKVTEKSDRLDDQPKQEYTANSGNIGLYIGDSEDMTLYFDIKNPTTGIAIPKGEDFKIWVDHNNITNSEHNFDELETNLNLNCQTEIPGIVVYLEEYYQSTWWTDMGRDVDFFMPYAYSIASYNQTSGHIEHFNGDENQVPSQGTWSVSPYATRVINEKLFETNQMMPTDVLSILLHGYDYDGEGDNPSNESGGFLSFLRDKYENQIIDEINEDYSDEYYAQHLFGALGLGLIMLGIIFAGPLVAVIGLIIIFLGYSMKDTLFGSVFIKSWYERFGFNDGFKKNGITATAFTEKDGQPKLHGHFKKKELSNNYEFYK